MSCAGSSTRDTRVPCIGIRRMVCVSRGSRRWLVRFAKKTVWKILFTNLLWKWNPDSSLKKLRTCRRRESNSEGSRPPLDRSDRSSARSSVRVPTQPPRVRRVRACLSLSPSGDLISGWVAGTDESKWWMTRFISIGLVNGHAPRQPTLDPTCSQPTLSRFGLVWLISHSYKYYRLI